MSVLALQKRLFISPFCVFLLRKCQTLLAYPLRRVRCSHVITFLIGSIFLSGKEGCYRLNKIQTVERISSFNQTANREYFAIARTITHHRQQHPGGFKIVLFNSSVESQNQRGPIKNDLLVASRNNRRCYLNVFDLT